jgi:hypothetical protein
MARAVPKQNRDIRGGIQLFFSKFPALRAQSLARAVERLPAFGQSAHAGASQARLEL